MKKMFVRFAKDESGATAIEYGLIAAGLAVAVITMMATLSEGLSTVPTDINAKRAVD